MDESDKIPEEIDTTERWFPRDHKAEIVLRYEFARQYTRDRTVLDVGCGVAYGSRILASEAKEVYGIDYSDKTIRFATEHYGHSRLSLLTMDGKAIAFKSNSFDTVVCIEVFEHIKDAHLLLSEIKRVLKDKGQFVMSTPNKGFWNRDREALGFSDPFHVNMVSFTRLRRFLSQHFVSFRIYGIRSQHGLLYGLLRVIDIRNMRLLLSGKKRRNLKHSLTGEHDTICPKEIRRARFWNAHSWQFFLAVCST